MEQDEVINEERATKEKEEPQEGKKRMLQASFRLSALTRVATVTSRTYIFPKSRLPIIPNGYEAITSIPIRHLCLATQPTYTMALKRNFGLTTAISGRVGEFLGKPSLLTPPTLPTTSYARSVTKWSLSKGKRKTVSTVLKRFKRLHWYGRGIWIRPRAGASKRIWRKSPAQRRRCKTHVFVNGKQSSLLDKMVTRYWRKKRFYPDDPYQSYMSREHHRENQGYPREYF
ncbi:hypothetical protein Pcinc_035425 [Petrolisthes cinctipes]|uniref:Large ribosomal subunit protein bL35m n=1 Tax=Petrolisthes cinctipes TaxID=88211 RepID=A0AAE1EPV5_PETCI|nr:hypothetical protein Pcinc_035425 [Petrolisthes cinctipes]